MVQTETTTVTYKCDLHGELKLSEIKVERQHNRKNPRKRCKACESLRVREYQASPEGLARYQQYYAKNRMRILANTTRWRIENRDLNRKQKRKSKQKGIDELMTGYIKERLTRGTILTYADITDVMVQLKRVQLMMLRAAKLSRGGSYAGIEEDV